MAQVCGDMMDLETPKKSLQAEPSTPRRSERKRALFPTLSPQTSDLGHMSPLGSSPDRYSSAPATPDSFTMSPVKRPVGPVSPFGRKVSASTLQLKSSPRKKFMLLGKALKQDQNVLKGVSPITSKKKDGVRQSQKASENPLDIVPADQLEQTLLSVMDDSDCPDSPQSEHTPGSKDLVRASTDITSSQPLTPSKRRSVPASGSGSTTSTSPQSGEQKQRFSLKGSRSAGVELPRARTSLFSSSSLSTSSKRPRDDGIYLTGRNSKRRRTYGEINAGVSTGIRRPPKVKPKSTTGKKLTKVKSVWDVGPKSAAKKRNFSPIKLPAMSLLTKPVKKSDEQISAASASASLHIRSKRAHAKDEENSSAPEEDDMDVESSVLDPSKRFLKGHSKPRSATITISKNIRIRVHKGRFILDKPAPVAPVKRRKLYSHEKQMKDINAFDDNEEDVADSTRGEVQNILQKLDEDKSINPESDSLKSKQVKSQVKTQLTDDQSKDSPKKAGKHKASPAAPTSPAKNHDLPSEGLMSPLSQLASSTSTLSIDVGGDTVHLTEAQVKALSAVPDFIMEDDDLPLCEPLPEEEKAVCETNHLKENENLTACDTDMTPIKYFPIFTSNFSHQKVPVSPVHAKRKRSLLGPIGNDQYQLDAGQKRFGATECGTCSLIYQMGEPDDELAHQEFHNAVKDLKFLGWKHECVIGQYGLDRIIVIRPGDPKSWWSKALEVLNVADRELGFAEGVKCDPEHSMVYFYVSAKSVKGCLLAIPVKNANKMLETSVEPEGIDCCTAEEYPVKCGVSRIWVHRPYRRSSVATRLMDCMRKNFIFGHVLSSEEIAFSSPTVAGKIFAEHYTGRKDFFVYTQI